MNRYKYIDICRFVAALMVINIHTFMFASIDANLDFVFTRVLCRVGGCLS